MNINYLISILKKKLEDEIIIQSIKIEDKSFLHASHKGNDKKKFHLKISIISNELSKMNRIQSNRKIHKILAVELRNNIHSLQILIT